MGWPSCFAVDSPAVFAALSVGLLCYAALSGFLRRLGFGAARAVAAFFLDGCSGVAQSELGRVTVASWGCFQSFPRGVAALLAALEMLVGAVAVSSSSSSQYEWVELESDHEPEPPCTMVDTQGTGVFDIPAEARMRGLTSELMHFVFEHGVSEGLRLAECKRGQVRARDRLNENVFDLPAVARRRGWDEHELMHMVFEFGEDEGMRRMEELMLEDGFSSVVFQGGVMQEPRVCLALDELLLVSEVRQASVTPEPAKSVQILFRGQHGFGVDG